MTTEQIYKTSHSKHVHTHTCNIITAAAAAAATKRRENFNCQHKYTGDSVATCVRALFISNIFGKGKSRTASVHAFYENQKIFNGGRKCV